MRFMKPLFVALITLSAAHAAPPVAKVTTAAGLRLNGKDMPDKTAPTWPVSISDKVTTSSHPALMMLPRGDRAELDAETSVVLTDRGGSLTLELISGKLCLNITHHSTIQAYAAGAPLTLPKPFEGSVTLPALAQQATMTANGCKIRLGHMSAGEKAALAAGAIGAAGGAAAVATGQAVKAVSPTH